jgi:light-regulated signal transduction histidine kinase (bacteriophytochrome)
MEAYQSILTDRDPQNLHEERRDPQLESQETILNERIMNMLEIMSHDIREPLISISATLKLLSRGYYGKMDEGVANNLKDLLSKTVGLIGITEEYLGSISCRKNYTKPWGET